MEITRSLKYMDNNIPDIEETKYVDIQDAMAQVSKNFEYCAAGIENLSKRISIMEEAFNKMPPPGADMIQYKPPGSEEYKNLASVFEDLYDRINTIETVLGI